MIVTSLSLSKQIITKVGYVPLVSVGDIHEIV